MVPSFVREREMDISYSGGIWYARALVRSPSAQRLWLALEGADRLDAWVDGRPVLLGRARPWALRSRGPELAQVEVPAGVAELDADLRARVRVDEVDDPREAGDEGQQDAGQQEGAHESLQC